MRLKWRPLVVDALVIGAVAFALSRFGSVVVTGASMRPALEPGDVVLFTRSGAGLRTGGMVVLGRPGHRYVHRVAAVRADGLIVTRGDANPIPDFEPTSTASVSGVVRSIVPLGRLLQGLASSRASARLGSQSHTGSYDGDGAREGVASHREGLSTERARPASRAVHSISCELKARSRAA